MPEVIETEGYGTIIKSLTESLATLETTVEEGGGGGGPLNEETLREASNDLTTTMFFNYKRLNSVGHPHPNAWPHGAATVEWTKLVALQNRNVRIGIGGEALALEQITPWQGCAAIDTQELITGFLLPTSPVLGDVVDVWVARGGPCGMADAGDGGTILSWGSTCPIPSNAVYRFTCTDITGPVWSVDDRSVEEWIDAVNTEAVGRALLSGGLAANSVLSLASSRTVVWRPFEDPGAGYVTSWSDAVAAVNQVRGPTEIQIEVLGDPGDTTVIIPGGTWQLNDTTIVGVAKGSDTDTNYRGVQSLLYVVTEGDANNPTWIKGCAGLTNIFWRATDYNTNPVNGDEGSYVSKSGDTVTFTVNSSYTFGSKDVGKPIRIGSIDPYATFGDDTSEADNRGTFIITAVLSGSTFQFINPNAVVPTQRVLVVSVDLPAVGQPISVDIDAVTYTYVVLEGDDATAAAVALAAVIAADCPAFTATSSVGDLTITARETGTAANAVVFNNPANLAGLIETAGTDGDVNNSTIGWSLCTSVFITEVDNYDSQSFILDNSDFRFGGDYNWGSMYVAPSTNLFMKLQNGASVRWHSLIVDDYVIIQSDGGGSWVGSQAFAGNGHVDVYPMSGTQVRTWQPSIASWTLHEPYTVYLPSNEANWTSVPDSVHEALDVVAERLGDRVFGTASTYAATDFKRSSGWTRLAPTGPGSLGDIDPTATPAVAIDTSGCSAGTVTGNILDGTYDGQEIVLLGGPWGGGVSWDLTCTHSAFQSGSTLHFTGLAGSITLKWWAYSTAWFIVSKHGLVSIT